MPVKRELVQDRLTKTYVPNWHCPACTGGYLKLMPNALHFLETSDSRAKQHHEAWDPSWVEYRFTALLVCNNEQCQEPVVLAGRGNLFLVPMSDEGDSDYIEFFHPAVVTPSPALITLPADCPVEVTTELRKSFDSSWGDFSAAANHIRSAVERLLDHLGEPKYTIGKSGKNEWISLHKRIEGLAKSDLDLSNSLLAVKWLGNAGSHSDHLTQDDIYDALDILEVILNDLFIGHRCKINDLIVSINKHKGPARDNGDA